MWSPHCPGDFGQGEVWQDGGNHYSGNEQLWVFYLIETTKTLQYLSWSSLTSSDIISAKQSFIFGPITNDNKLITISDSDSCPCLHASSMLKTDQSAATIECWIVSVRDIYNLTTTRNCHLFWLACLYSISWMANNVKPKNIPAAISNKIYLYYPF